MKCFLLGNVKNAYFQWQSIDNIHVAAYNLMRMLLIDTCGSVFTIIIIVFMCRINLLQILLHSLKEFGFIFAVHQAYLLDYQFCIVESK